MNKPCPWCGSLEQSTVDIAGDRDRVAVGCCECGSVGPTADDIDSARVLWDERSNELIARQRAAERRTILHEL